MNIADTFKINKNEYRLFIVTMVLSIVFNIQIINDLVGWPFWIGICILSFFTPYSSIYILLSSQVFATPEYYPLTLSQLYIVTWVVFNIGKVIKKKKVIFYKNQKITIIFLFLFLIWSLIISLFKNDIFSATTIFLIFGTMFIVYQEIKSINNINFIAFSITMAAFSAVIIFALNYFLDVGIVSSKVTSLIVFRGGVQRIGVGNGDWNFIGLIMVIALGGLFHFMVFFYKKTDKKYVLFFFLVLLTIFSIILTLSRASILGIIVVVPTYLFVSRKIDFVKLYKYLLALIPLVFLAFFSFQVLFPQQYNALTFFQKKANDPTGRDEIWLEGISLISDNPIFGNNGGLLKSYNYYAHNTLLEVGISYGIVGLVLFILVIIYSLKLPRGRSNVIKLLFILTIYSGLSLSQVSSKFFWVILTILISFKFNLLDLQNRISLLPFNTKPQKK